MPSAGCASRPPGATRAAAPLLIVHGSADEVIPIESTRVEVRRLCQVGDTVELRIIEGADHGDPLWAEGRLEELAHWIRERIEGMPATSTCIAR